MKVIGMGCGLLLVVGLLVGGVGVGKYNSLVGLQENVEGAWSQVENAYQRRADLIPNLVETVKGASEFERDTLTQVVEARAKATQVSFDKAPTVEQLKQFEAAQSGLSSALSRLLVTVERYPELQAVQAFRDLQFQLEGTENRISVERGRFTEATQGFNTARRTFPANLLAGFFGFDEKPYFAAVEGADEAPKVEF